MDNEIGTVVCLDDGCVEVVNTYNPYTKYRGMIVQIAVVIAIGIGIIAIIKRKSKKKQNI